MLQAAPIRSHMDRGRGKEKKNPFSTWSNYFNPMKPNRLEGVKNDNIFQSESEFLNAAGRHFPRTVRSDAKPVEKKMQFQHNLIISI